MLPRSREYFEQLILDVIQVLFTKAPTQFWYAM